MRRKFPEHIIKETYKFWHDYSEVELTELGASDALSDFIEFMEILEQWDERLKREQG